MMGLSGSRFAELTSGLFQSAPPSRKLLVALSGQREFVFTALVFRKCQSAFFAGTSAFETVSHHFAKLTVGICFGFRPKATAAVVCECAVEPISIARAIREAQGLMPTSTGRIAPGGAEVKWSVSRNDTRRSQRRSREQK
jgi:hypothetical protein